ncbi:beta-lactamase [Thermotomaculum hydrothermale]|uniref:Beta-lactamase n=1 Tax=Thermotomaculum hydrothermale TaxID=981385 RepID=A0A7R6SYD8_9BACT|nr:serine hydrolase [Thermotomaculum hydrothermale]BBB31770.1 beta-lactamase [Thermotomaculum hydrothermale]
MKKIKFFLLSLFLVLFISCGGGSAKISANLNPQNYPFLGSGKFEGSYFPTQSFRECTPEEVGMDSKKLVKVYNYAANPNIKTEGLIILRHNYIVFETYLNGFTPDTLHESYSIAKSISSCLTGIAIDKGYLTDENVFVKDFYPQWDDLPDSDCRNKITVKNLLTMTSGLEWNEHDYYGDTSQNDAFIMYQSADNYLEYVLSKNCIHQPGSFFNYSSGDSMLLSGILKEATGEDVEQFAVENLFDKIGIERHYWQRDNAGNVITAWGIGLTLRDYARFGLLYLHKGNWDGNQIVSREWVEKSTSPAYQNINWYGYSFWLMPVFSDYQNYNLPSDIYLAWGIHTQQIFVIPDYDIVAVRLGNDNDPEHDDWVETEFLKLVIDCVKDK